MRLNTSIAEMRSQLNLVRNADRTVGLVATMGSLHRGHLSLIKASTADNDVTVTTIFVNPLQFSADEDLADYPRDLNCDLQLCESAGVDYVFAPSPQEMYPTPVLTTVNVDAVSEPLEGRSRSTHFLGVATVVAKLFSIVGPCRAYFGAKDWQQVVVVRRMVHDLSMPVKVVVCPTVREADGLALSSRNGYLTPPQRAQAPVLRRALDAGLAALGSGERNACVVADVMTEVVATAPLGQLDYSAAVQADTLVVDGPLHDEVRLLLAVRFDKARLIDNDGCILSKTTI